MNEEYIKGLTYTRFSKSGFFRYRDESGYVFEIYSKVGVIGFTEEDISEIKGYSKEDLESLLYELELDKMGNADEMEDADEELVSYVSEVKDKLKIQNKDFADCLYAYIQGEPI